MRNVEITETNNVTMISIDGCTLFELSEDKFKKISNILNPKKITGEERTAAVLRHASRPEGTTVEEVAIHQDSGEQNCYNSIFKKLEADGVIYKNGEHRKTRRNRFAAVYVLTAGG